MNEPTTLIENEVTRISLSKERYKNKVKVIRNKLVWIVILISIISEGALAFKLYKLYSKSALPMSLIIMYLSLSTLLFFLSIIMALRHSKVKPDNPYYQYLFMIISTIIGFTFSTSFQEFLNEHEEKEDLIATLNPAILYYNDLYKGLYDDLSPIVDNSVPPHELYEALYSVPPEDIRETVLLKSEKVKNSRETMLNVAYSDPQSFKGLSTELKVFLSSSAPLTIYYDKLENTSSERALPYYINYETLRLEVRNRRSMLQAEVKRLKGAISEKQFQSEVKRIAEAKREEQSNIDTRGLEVLHEELKKQNQVPPLGE